MKALFISLFVFAAILPAHSTEHDIIQAEQNPSIVQALVLKGVKDESQRFMKIAPRLISLEQVIISGISDDAIAANLVSSVAACKNVRTINFRDCALQQLPSNLRMLTQVTTFISENSRVQDGEQFYNAIADMPNVVHVKVTSDNFRELPRSFFRLRVMESIELINEDLQLARGYDLNTKTPEQLRNIETVQFGFGNDALNLSYTCYNTEAGKAHVEMFRDVLQGAYRQSNVFYSPVSKKAFLKSHPLVKPPVAGMDVYPDVYTVNALPGSVLDYGSGTRIIVPSMAFQDADGNPVTGNIDITYREFRDVVDVVLSGIPMKYDSGGVVGDFRSAGMFEIEASQNGTEVFLREGKQIDMKFAVTDTAGDFNFYRLDEKNGWQYLNNTGSTESDQSASQTTYGASTRTPAQQPNVVVSPSSPVIADSLTYIGGSTYAVGLWSNGIKDVRVRNWIRDTTSFERRYEDTCYFGSRRGYFPGATLTQNAKRESSSVLYLRSEKSGDNHTIISIRQCGASYGINPELSAYSGYYWKMNEKMSEKEISNRFGRKSGINDCRLLQNGTDYMLELKYHWGFDTIIAEPIQLDKDGNAVSLPDDRKERMFNAYTKRLNGRRDQMVRDNARQVHYQNTRVLRAHNDSVRVWRGIRREMNDDEKLMDFETFRDYARAQLIGSYQAVMNTMANSRYAVYQALSVSGMGIYNCDQVSRMEKPRDFVARTISIAGTVITPVAIYVVNKVRNMVFTYSSGFGLLDPEGVSGSYDSNTRNSMLATDTEGNLYYSNEDQFDTATMGVGLRLEFEAVQVSGPKSTPGTVRQAVFSAQ